MTGLELGTSGRFIYSIFLPAKISPSFQSKRINAMSTLILSRNCTTLRAGSYPLLRLYPSLYTFRAASLNSGINRGLRRSKGIGFRETIRTGGSRDSQPTGEIRRSAHPSSISRSQTNNDLGQGRSRKGSKDGGEGNSVRIRRGKKTIKDEEERPRQSSWSQNRASAGGAPRQSRDFDRSGEGRRPREYGQERPAYTPRDSKSRSFDRHKTSFEDRSQDRRQNVDKTYPSLSENRPSYGSSGRQRASESRDRRPPNRVQAPRQNFDGAHPPSSRFKRDPPTDRQDGEASSRPGYSPDLAKRTGFNRNSPSDRQEGEASSRPKYSPDLTKRIPLSIPYTTPASEFLYGTSVVEAALNSQGQRRRKLYKLYVYAGENREDVDPAGLERVARRKGIPVARVGLDWIRVLDKMSGGRPHNGYILEASPLARLPVASLAELTDKEGEPGFKVVLDPQSREEAAVNGVSDFIKLPAKSARNPFVLFLDSIEDPGNLGGIIRTASFLGVTAVAYSVRNSASFSPVVLKASAGASESVTLFAVNKPAGFIANSKLAGWKIFAAVAPSKSRALNAPPSITTDYLEDPLSEDPCILMLGGEGEGLRANLRSKADVDLVIRSGPSRNVDSLNVSVAAGILCDAFLKRNQTRRKVDPVPEVVEPQTATEPTGELF
jgi:21S rRNA (GM2251-2'-O)-methyltransferase